MRDRLCWLPPEEFRRVLDGITDQRERCRAFAALSRINTLYMIMRAGSGHLGSSFSAADVVSQLLLAGALDPAVGAADGSGAKGSTADGSRADGTDGDVYFSSKGHDVPGLYAALIGLGRLDAELIHRLRRRGGLPGHPDVHTPRMLFNTGSLGMGISKAKGLVLADRLTGRQRRVYVLTGDGELQEGQNWEALAGAVRHGMGELTVIVDHNKIQSDTWVCDVSDLGDLPAKFASFGWGVLRCDGNDHNQLAAVLAERAQRLAGRPVVIIADTIKGAGAPTFAATSMPEGDWRYRFHSGAPSSAEYASGLGELLAAANELLHSSGLAPLAPRTVETDARRPAAGPRFPEIYGQELVALAATDQRIVALDADLILDTGLIEFAGTYPDRFFECGIAEQDMVSMAGGLAAGGLLPFVHSFSCFLHARPNEQIYNNATEHRKVVYVGSLAGLLPAGPGHSHQAVRDVSALAAVPGLVIVEPASPAQVAAAVGYCAAATDSVYLRLVSAPVPEEVAELPAGPLQTGRGTVLRSGGPVVALGAGPVVLAQLLRAAAELSADELELTVVNLPWLNRIDPDWLTGLAAAASHLFVVENQYTRGGQADLVARALLEQPGKGAGRDAPRFRGIGLTSVPACGTDDEALGAHGLRADQLAALIRAEVRVAPAAGLAGADSLRAGHR